MNPPSHPSRILVTGHLGYIGTVLTPLLVRRGHDVVGLDTDLFRRCTYGSESRILPVPSIERDIRDADREDLRGFDTVIHLAGLSNDPLGDMDPDLTDQINHVAAVRLASEARAAGVRRFIFSSTCSNYGASGNDLLDEDSPFNPVTPYGIAKVAAERGIRSLAGTNFTPVILRSGTACGISPRIRFDLVVNNLVAWALTTGQVHLKSDGRAWRPIVHVEDIARAFVAVTEVESDRVHDRAYNVGRSDQNFLVRDIATIVHDAVPDSEVTFGEGAGSDLRNYRVNCSRISRELPEFQPRWTVPGTVAQVRDEIRRLGLSQPEFEGSRYQRLGHIRSLIDSDIIDQSIRQVDAPLPHFARRAAESSCRSCRTTGLRPVLDLGQSPRSDGLLPADAEPGTEPLRPLELSWCPNCTLVQILESRPREELFGEDYPYFSSFSRDLMTHARNNANRLIAARGLDESNFVVELASNDGSLLANFAERDIPVLGIDPAPRQVRASIERGVPALAEFFDLNLAREIRSKHGAADVIVANNVLAHVSDLHGFVDGIAHLLTDEGIASIEFPYLADLLDHVEFDTIYHEHLCYYSLESVSSLLEARGLRVLDVTRLQIHGGSLRITVGRDGDPQETVATLRAEEAARQLGSLPSVSAFASRVRSLREELIELLHARRAAGRRIAAYGAAAKGTMLLNAIGAGPDLVEAAYDRNPHKHGRLLPGVRIPVLPTEKLQEDPPDDLLILPWNFKEEIMRQESDFHNAGGRFIIPIPTPTVI